MKKSLTAETKMMKTNANLMSSRKIKSSGSYLNKCVRFVKPLTVITTTSSMIIMLMITVRVDLQYQ